jgi:hypothetical protein
VVQCLRLGLGLGLASLDLESDFGGGNYWFDLNFCLLFLFFSSEFSFFSVLNLLHLDLMMVNISGWFFSFPLRFTTNLISSITM